jgi:nucleoside-diphosphate-sugar epimerase
MKRLLVTGASGFIGRHSLPHLLTRDFEVHAVCNRRPDWTIDQITWHTCDLLDPNDTRSLVQGIAPSHMLHFAWNVQPGTYQASEDNVRWYQAGIELLQVFAAVGGRRAVFAGTCFEYDLTYGVCSEGETPCAPRTLYGVCKLALAEAVTAHPPAGVSTAWGRIFYVYGPHEPASRLVPSVIHAVLRGERPRCTHGRQRRDFLHVDDVGSAFAALVDTDIMGVVNVASGTAVSIRSLAASITNLMEASEPEFGLLAVPQQEPTLIVADVRRLRELVGWVPRWGLSAGLRDTIQWWRRLET